MTGGYKCSRAHNVPDVDGDHRQGNSPPVTHRKPVDSLCDPCARVVAERWRNEPVESLKSLRGLVTGWVLLLKSATSRASSGGALLGNDLA